VVWVHPGEREFFSEVAGRGGSFFWGNRISGSVGKSLEFFPYLSFALAPDRCFERDVFREETDSRVEEEQTRIYVRSRCT